MGGYSCEWAMPGMNRDPAFCMRMTRMISNMNCGNSLENAARDDCNNYAKAAPPTIANGRVYLGSFGTRNTGSGQLCVYGLLPDGAAPSPPSSVNASSGDGQVSLTWAATQGHHVYREAIDQRSGGGWAGETGAMNRSRAA